MLIGGKEIKERDGTEVEDTHGMLASAGLVRNNPSGELKSKLASDSSQQCTLIADRPRSLAAATKERGKNRNEDGSKRNTAAGLLPLLPCYAVTPRADGGPSHVPEDRTNGEERAHAVAAHCTRRARRDGATGASAALRR
jgi:hypothetical protein